MDRSGAQSVPVKPAKEVGTQPTQCIHRQTDRQTLSVRTNVRFVLFLLHFIEGFLRSTWYASGSFEIQILYLSLMRQFKAYNMNHAHRPVDIRQHIISIIQTYKNHTLTPHIPHISSYINWPFFVLFRIYQTMRFWPNVRKEDLSEKRTPNSQTPKQWVILIVAAKTGHCIFIVDVTFSHNVVLETISHAAKSDHCHSFHFPVALPFQWHANGCWVTLGALCLTAWEGALACQRPRFCCCLNLLLNLLWIRTGDPRVLLRDALLSCHVMSCYFQAKMKKPKRHNPFMPRVADQVHFTPFVHVIVVWSLILYKHVEKQSAKHISTLSVSGAAWVIVITLPVWL